MASGSPSKSQILLSGRCVCSRTGIATSAIHSCEMLPRERKSLARSCYDVFDDEGFAEQELDLGIAPKDVRSISRRATIKRANQRYRKALQKSASDLKLVTVRDYRGAWNAATVLHSIFPPESGVAVSALGALGGVNEQKTKRHYTMVLCDLWQKTQTAGVQAALQEMTASTRCPGNAGSDEELSAANIGIGFDETLQRVGHWHCKRGAEARGCLARIHQGQLRKHIAAHKGSSKLATWSRRHINLLTQTMVFTGSVDLFKLNSQDIQQTLGEDVAIPPRYLAKTDAFHLLAAFIEELEALLGQPLNTWLDWVLPRCEWVLLTIHADRASANLKLLRMVSALAKVLAAHGRVLLVVWDPCSLHPVNNISDSVLKLRSRQFKKSTWPTKSALYSGSKLMRLWEFSDSVKAGMRRRKASFVRRVSGPGEAPPRGPPPKHTKKHAKHIPTTYQQSTNNIPTKYQQRTKNIPKVYQTHTKKAFQGGSRGGPS